jgi:hypothetical protein
MRYSPHSPYFSPDLAVPILNICTRTEVWSVPFTARTFVPEKIPNMTRQANVKAQIIGFGYGPKWHSCAWRQLNGFTHSV